MVFQYSKNNRKPSDSVLQSFSELMRNFRLSCLATLWLLDRKLHRKVIHRVNSVLQQNKNIQLNFRNNVKIINNNKNTNQYVKDSELFGPATRWQSCIVEVETASAGREKMMCIILLLINLTSCVCGVSKPYDTPLKYQAEENSDVQVEWSFSSETDIPLPSLKIHCQKVLGLKVFYHLDNCIEESQHEQFAGRVQCDKDALRGGRVRLHLSRVKMNDSGVYLCRMATDFGRKVKVFSLDITAAVDKPKPVTPIPAPVTPTPAPVSQGRISLYVVLGLAAAAVLVLLAVRRCSLKSCRTMKMCSVAHQ
ncbi:hypothetical protein ABVT39_019066 [Epinephelus coioides]